MDKWMCFGSIGVAVLVFLISILDLVLGMPFSNGEAFGAFLVPDIGGVLAGALLAYLGWNAYRDVR